MSGEFATVAAGGPARAHEPLGPAAQRAAEVMLRSRPSTRSSYQSVYRRFEAWLAAYTGEASPPVACFSADAIVAYLAHLEGLQRAAGTIRKEHAALNRLARYLHAIGAIDATEILLIDATRNDDQARTRDALDEDTWRAVKQIARTRLIGDARSRASKVTAARDYAMLVLLGDAGLRSDELRRLPRDPFTRKRTDSDRVWLCVLGKRSRVREVPLQHDVSDALLRWEKARPPEAQHSDLLFPALGRQRRDGSFPDALPVLDAHGEAQPRGALSDRALQDIVRPIMHAAGVPAGLCHPHALRHTYGTLFMRRGGTLHDLAELMGHTSIDTTRVYVHTSREQLQDAVGRNERANPSLLQAGRQRRERRR